MEWRLLGKDAMDMLVVAGIARYRCCIWIAVEGRWELAGSSGAARPMYMRVSDALLVSAHRRRLDCENPHLSVFSGPAAVGELFENCEALPTGH